MDLSLDGMLSFNIAATTGQFRLSRLELVTTLEERPLAVPGPESLNLLLLGGLFGAGVHRMRSRNKLHQAQSDA